MTTTLSWAMRPAIIMLATFMLSACSTTTTPQSAGTNPAAMSMKDGMSCACCGTANRTEKAGGCCAGMSSNGKGMMCTPKAKSDMSGAHHTKHDAVTDIYASAMKTMHENMHITPSGDADVDFMRGMIPHHQGAIDMAEILRTHGKDPAVRKLAEEIIRTQQSEIDFMQAWLAKRGQ